jgi:hypothetical protein
MLFGYNRAYFFPSDITFKGEGHNFTVSNAKAHDDWQLNSDKEIPQISLRMGYFFNSEEMWGLEAGYDWVNYILPENSKVKVHGIINDTLVNSDKYLTEDFLRYEHTHGSGYLELKLVKGFLIYGNHNYSQMFFALAKAGGGIAITKTYASILGESKQNDFNISGFTGTFESMVKYTYKTHWDIETGLKGEYINYTNVPTVDKGSATHYVFSVQWVIAIGFEVRL